MTKPLVVAIDGPAGAGKSTVAQKLAGRLRSTYVDSGATYRAAALKVIESRIKPDDERAAEAIAAADIQITSDGTRCRVLLDGRDVTAKIRSPEVTRAAATVSRHPEVRRKMINLQRSLVRARGIVMEGRDIGTVVFPDASLKIFLKANPQARARRRLQQESKEGRQATLQKTASEIRLRDRLDAEREISPLVPALDAYVIDSTRLTADQVVERILELARGRNLIDTRGQKGKSKG